MTKNKKVVQVGYSPTGIIFLNKMLYRYSQIVGLPEIFRKFFVHNKSEKDPKSTFRKFLINDSIEKQSVTLLIIIEVE